MTNEQIRARIVGALSASAMNAQENAECIRYLDQIQTLEEAVVQLRKQWQEAETLICMMCEHCDWEDHDGLLCMTTDCGEINGYPCCGKFAHRFRLVPVAEGLPKMHEEVYEGLGDNGEDVACLVSDPVLGFTDEGRYVVGKNRAGGMAAGESLVGRGRHKLHRDPLDGAAGGSGEAGGSGMTDTDKVKLINHIVADAMEYGNYGCTDYVNGILVAIGSVCDYVDPDA